MTIRIVPGFLPSTSGFRFANAFAKVPLRRIGIPGVVDLGIGDASNGLCGGMVFAARDHFEAGLPITPATTAPSYGPLFEYLVDRLFDSFELPSGPTTYLRLMNPLLSDGETVWSRLGIAPHGRRWRIVHQEWPRVRAEIDAGHPCALGLVRVRSADPFDLKHNHQVLAFGYRLEGSALTLQVYDPNRPGDDDVRLSMDLADESRRPTMIPASRPVLSFFRVGYSPSIPPPT
jgi:hypothetical protein